MTCLIQNLQLIFHSLKSYSFRWYKLNAFFHCLKHIENCNRHMQKRQDVNLRAVELNTLLKESRYSLKVQFMICYDLKKSKSPYSHSNKRNLTLILCNIIMVWKIIRVVDHTDVYTCVEQMHHTVFKLGHKVHSEAE